MLIFFCISFLDGKVVVDGQGFIDEEVSDETLYVTIDGRTVPMAIANILKLEGVDVPQGVRVARVMEIERRYEDRYNAETMPAVPAVPAAPEGTNVSELSPAGAEVAADEAYRNIWNDDSRMASEVLARLSGGENYRRTMQDAVETVLHEVVGHRGLRALFGERFIICFLFREVFLSRMWA